MPFTVKLQLETTGAEKLGRQRTAGAVDFRPWTPELTLHDLAIAKAGAASAAGVTQSAGLPATAAGSATPALQPPVAQASSRLENQAPLYSAELQSLLPADTQDAIKSIAANDRPASAASQNDVNVQEKAPVTPWKVPVARVAVQRAA